jgi:predicted RNA binding protein YcfA (HicA-like mRNA interferase family)
MKRADLISMLEASGFRLNGGSKHAKYTHPSGTLVTLPRGTKSKELRAPFVSAVKRRIQAAQSLESNGGAMSRRTDFATPQMIVHNPPITAGATGAKHGPVITKPLADEAPSKDNNVNGGGHPRALTVAQRQQRDEQALELRHLREASGLTQLALSRLLRDAGWKNRKGEAYLPQTNFIGMYESGQTPIPNWEELCALLRDTKPKSEPEPEPTTTALEVATEPVVSAPSPDIAAATTAQAQEQPITQALPVMDVTDVPITDVDEAYRIVRSRFAPEVARKFDELWRSTSPDLMKKQTVVTQAHGDLWVERHQDGSVTIRPRKTESGAIETLRLANQALAEQRNEAVKRAEQAESRLKALKELLV